MNYRSLTLPTFWDLYDALPEEIRERASKQYEIFAENPRHPSLQLKRVGAFWSARVTDSYRVLAVRDGNTFTWFWIGSHDEYERMVRGS